MKKTPLLWLLISFAILLSLFGIAGKRSIYASESYKPESEPAFAVVLRAAQKGTYPWALFRENEREAAYAEAERIKKMEEELRAASQKTPDATGKPDPTPTPAPVQTESARTIATATASPTPAFPEGRLEPLRESTYDEYLNHVSADIYGDLGVQRAASYSFVEVPLSYFDDALFIGDSRTVGLGKYTELSEHATFLSETSLTAAKVFQTDFRGKGHLEDYLTENEYAKIYLMVGINELGTGTTEFFIEQYTGVVDRIHELAPDAVIFLQAIMNVDAEKNESDPIFNNTNILGRNHAIATLADNRTFFYIDVNEAVCDEDGNLDAALTFDHLHLRGASNELWEAFLLKHGVAASANGTQLVTGTVSGNAHPTAFPTATEAP